MICLAPFLQTPTEILKHLLIHHFLVSLNIIDLPGHINLNHILTLNYNRFLFLNGTILQLHLTLKPIDIYLVWSHGLVYFFGQDSALAWHHSLRFDLSIFDACTYLASALTCVWFLFFRKEAVEIVSVVVTGESVFSVEVWIYLIEFLFGLLI